MRIYNLLILIADHSRYMITILIPTLATQLPSSVFNLLNWSSNNPLLVCQLLIIFHPLTFSLLNCESSLARVLFGVFFISLYLIVVFLTPIEVVLYEFFFTILTNVRIIFFMFPEGLYILGCFKDPKKPCFRHIYLSRIFQVNHATYLPPLFLLILFNHMDLLYSLPLF